MIMDYIPKKYTKPLVVEQKVIRFNTRNIMQQAQTIDLGANCLLLGFRVDRFNFVEAGGAIPSVGATKRSSISLEFSGKSMRILEVDSYRTSGGLRSINEWNSGILKDFKVKKNEESSMLNIGNTHILWNTGFSKDFYFTSDSTINLSKASRLKLTGVEDAENVMPSQTLELTVTLLKFD